MQKTLNILLVEPENSNVLVGGTASPPLWPCVLSALTPNPHKVDFLQCCFEQFTHASPNGYDLVGVTCRTDSADRAYEIGDICRRQGITCVMGGIHAFFCPEEAKLHCDSVVLGEAECLWGRVVDDTAKGRLQEYYRCEHAERHGLPRADLSVVRKYRYAMPNATETVRGCPFNCSFCSASAYNGTRYRYKPVADVLSEIESWKRRSSLSCFADLNIASDTDKAKELLSALSRYRLSWLGNASVDVADDDELLRLLAEGGCSKLGIGMESISHDALGEVNKKHNRRVDYRELVRRVHEHNIDIIGYFIFGLDTDTQDTFRETVEYVIEADIDYPVFQILVPYPGTMLHEKLQKEGRLLSRDWSRYTRSDVVFQPRNMTKEELLRGVFWAYRQSYSVSRIARFFTSRWRGVRKTVEGLRMGLYGAKQMRTLKAHRRVPS